MQMGILWTKVSRRFLKAARDGSSHLRNCSRIYLAATDQAYTAGYLRRLDNARVWSYPGTKLLGLVCDLGVNPGQ